MSNVLRKTVYLRAAELVGNGWTQGAEARNAKGVSVSPFAKTAVSFCVMGALQRVLFEIIGDKDEAKVFALKAAGGYELQEFNEDASTTQAMVRDLLMEMADRS